LSPTDRHFRGYDWGEFAGKLDPVYAGGETRAATVRNALDRLSSHAHADDWILVHDAARPCLTVCLLERLIVDVADDDSGGLLAVPVADTLKRAGEDSRAVGTESRAGLWQAQTPQMFRYALLKRALRNCNDQLATDESAAVEALGIRPKLVLSDSTNFKITHAQDLALAKLLLSDFTEAP
jgi:2-C-methyl-D-erythritol 4-phosphate cytidylyltransferase